jgi:hypothetical protein
MQRKWLDVTRHRFYRQRGSSAVLATSLRVHQVRQCGDELGRCCRLQRLALLLDDFFCVVPDRCFEALLLAGGDGLSLYLCARFFVVGVRHHRRVVVWLRAIFNDATGRWSDFREISDLSGNQSSRRAVYGSSKIAVSGFRD